MDFYVAAGPGAGDAGNEGVDAGQIDAVVGRPVAAGNAGEILSALGTGLSRHTGHAAVTSGRGRNDGHITKDIISERLHSGVQARHRIGIDDRISSDAGSQTTTPDHNSILTGINDAVVLKDDVGAAGET